MKDFIIEIKDYGIRKCVFIREDSWNVFCLRPYINEWDFIDNVSQKTIDDVLNNTKNKIYVLKD